MGKAKEQGHAPLETLFRMLNLNETQARGGLLSKDKAKPVYSRARTAFLSLTPGDSKCALYCKGARCKYCTAQKPQVSLNQAIPGLYSTWVTEELLAMSRLQMDHFERLQLIDNFKRNRITSVINLQEPGEHAFCGGGVGPSGFSYDPEDLMKHSIYYYNFPMPDFESCSPHRLLDIVKVVQFAMSIGKVAVHCHAGHGRTGMVIAASLIYCKGMSPAEAVKCVRAARPASVQSSQQVEALHKFRLLVDTEGGLIMPPRKFVNITQYLKYNLKFLTNSETRLYGNIPKIAYIGMLTLLETFYAKVYVTFVTFDEEKFGRFLCDCKGAKKLDFESSEVTERLLLDHFRSTCSLYLKLTANGMSISTIERFLKTLDVFDIIYIIDLFFVSSFHQLTYRDDLLTQMLTRNQGFPLPNSENTRDWLFPFFFILECVACLPVEFHQSMCQLVSRWFLRKDEQAPEVLLRWISE